MTATRKLSLTAGLFALALIMVGVAAATHVVGPLFAAWAPLLAVPYVLTRPEPGVDHVFPQRPEHGAESSTQSRTGDGGRSDLPSPSEGASAEPDDA